MLRVIIAAKPDATRHRHARSDPKGELDAGHHNLFVSTNF